MRRDDDEWRPGRGGPLRVLVTRACGNGRRPPEQVALTEGNAEPEQRVVLRLGLDALADKLAAGLRGEMHQAGHVAEWIINGSSDLSSAAERRALRSRASFSSENRVGDFDRPLGMPIIRRLICSRVMSHDDRSIRVSGQATVTLARGTRHEAGSCAEVARKWWAILDSNQ
jgi:hypothetical protein